MNEDPNQNPDQGPNQDLKPQSLLKRSITPRRAFIICELIIYRFRDRNFKRKTPEYDLLTYLAQEVRKIRLAWTGKIP